MQLEAAKQTTDIAKGISVGLYDVGKDFVTGVWDFVTDPGETVEGVANSIMHPIKTYKYISKSISDSYERDMVNGDAYSRAHWVLYALSNRHISSKVEFINPPGRHHRAPSSKRAHNEIIDTSLDYDTFVRRLQMWSHYRYKGGV
ncbi:hypothetical protein M1D47_21165 [Bacillus sp. R1-10]